LMLHDLGKVKSKGVEFTTPEDLQDHPIRGIERIHEAAFVGAIARDIIEHHHERLDGAGLYHCAPGELSVHARIAAVADAFDRRTVDPSGQMVANSFEALRAMISEDPGAYDPKLLALFVRALSL
jgi:HD-GYP domain-containing protein (c-di-GMP phosphodiesterase class II)